MAPHTPPPLGSGPGDPGRSSATALLPLLQFTDGLFPAGGFAHSLGLETYVHDGRLVDAAGLEAFVVAHLEGAAGPSDAVAVALAARAATAGDVAALIALDARVDAMKVVPEARAASRQMGRQLLRVAGALASDPVLTAFIAATTARTSPGHHAVAFGVALGRERAPLEAVTTAYLYTTAAMLVSAGVRLLALGQLDGQRVLAAMRPRIARLAPAAARAESADDMWSFTIGLEIAGVRHATLDGRLFRS